MPATADNRDESAAFPGLKGITFGAPGVRAEVGDKTFEGDAAPAGVGLRAAGRYCDRRWMLDSIQRGLEIRYCGTLKSMRVIVIFTKTNTHTHIHAHTHTHTHIHTHTHTQAS
jgi:hypothetical protein